VASVGELPVIRRLGRRIAQGERGLSLVETMIALAVTSILAAAFLTMFIGFGGEVGAQEERAATLAAARGAVADLVVELRQAVDVDGDGAIVAALDASWSRLDLVFMSDRLADVEGPERYEYRLTNCRGVHCDLTKTITPADPGSGPNWTYTGTPHTRTVIENVRTDGPEPLFSGMSHRTGRPVVVTSCGATTPCSFELLQIRLRVDPRRNRSSRAVVEIREDVGFRNAPR